MTSPPSDTTNVLMRRLPALIVLAVSLVAGFVLSAPASADARAKIGVADQKPDMFLDERFLSLGIKNARLSVPWDALRYDFAARDVDTWLTRARSRGVRPLVTFQKSRVVKRPPTVAQFTREFKRFRGKYPWIRNYAGWNEPQIEPPREIKTEVGYYRAIRANCPSCTVLGADLLDTPSVTSYVRTFNRLAGARKPKAWGLHNYVTANRKQTKLVTNLLKAIGPAKLWITETGGLVARRNASKIKLPQGVAHAASTTRFILRTWGNNPRIPYLFLYHWDSSTPQDTWDSAFVGPDGRSRPSLDILRTFLRNR